MKFKTYSFKDLLKKIVDNRGKTCPTSDTGIPLIATNCVKNSTLFPVFEKVRYVDEETYNTWFRGHPEPGDMIFVCKGSPGQVCWTPDPVGYCIAQDMVAIRADETKVYPKYLFALLRTEQSQQKILNMHVGTLIPHFKKGDFGNLYFDIPEDMEYQKIVGDAYFDFCRKIHLNTQTNQTLESIAQAIFKSWFVDFEPVKAKMATLAEGGTREQAELAAMGAISGKSEVELAQLQQQNPEHYQQLAETAALFPSAMVESELGEIPEGWEVEPLSNHINIKHGFAFKGEYFSDSPTNLILVTPGNFRVGGGFKNDKLKFYNGPIPESFVFNSNDLMVTMTDLSKEADTLGYPALIPSSKTHKYLHNQRIGKVEFIKEAEIKNFIYQFFCSDFYRNEVLSGITGSTVKHTAPKKILSIKIAMDTRIAKIFSVNVNDLFKKISSNNSENSALEQLRDTLLPKLLSGEIDLSDIQSEVA